MFVDVTLFVLPLCLRHPFYFISIFLFLCLFVEVAFLELEWPLVALAFDFCNDILII